MDFAREVIADFIPDLIAGSVLLILGIIIPVFRLYWLIAGVNTAPKEELKKIDLEYVGKYFGIFIGGLGLLLMLNPFIFSFLGLQHYIQFIQPVTVVSVIASMFVFGRIKKNRINKQDNERT
jgi:hypothetical protein